MKRLLALLLVLLMSWTCTAVAESDPMADMYELTIPFDSIQYEGKWWSFSGMNFSFFLPTNWVENTEAYAGDANYEYAFQAEDLSAYFNIRFFWDQSTDTHEVRFKNMLQEIYAAEMSADVAPARLNGIDMVTYTVGENTGLGVVILMDGAFLMIESAPGSDENAALFLQVLSTYKIA